VRHGETDWNAERRLQGQLAPGPGLNAAGRAQAARLARRLAGEAAGRPFGAIYSSDLGRCRETAGAVADALGVPRDRVVLDARLRERALGPLEGRTLAAAAAGGGAGAEAARVLRSGGEDEAVPGGESEAQVRGRVGEAVREIARGHRGGRAVVVSHGGALAQVHFLSHGRHAGLPNCGAGVVLSDGAGLRATSWGDAAHLPGGAGGAFGGGREGG